MYAAAAVAVTSALALAPRLPEFDRTGTRRVSVLAAGSNAVTMGLGALVTAVGIMTYPDVAYPPASSLWPLLNNTVAVGCTAALAVGLAGRMIGSLAAVGGYAVNVWVQASDPRLAGVLPLNFGSDLEGGLDRAVRWPWLLALLAAAMWTGYARRNLPLLRWGWRGRWKRGS